MIRSSNYETFDQPLEFGVLKYWRMPGLKIYEDERECGGTQIRIALEFIWFYVNAMVGYTGREARRFDDCSRWWGFYFMNRINFVWRWGKKYVSWDLPFISTVFVKREILSLDRTRVVHLCRRGLGDFDTQDDVRRCNSVNLPYKYVTNRGEPQEVTANVGVERCTRRHKWTPIKRVEDSIWVNFSEGIGSERGSWKGGTTGCGWPLKRGETAEQGLRRMESQRRFE